MRSAMPKPQRTSLAKRRAEAHRARPRDYATSRQMMRPQASGVRARQPGMMQKLEDGVKAQAKKLLAAERQARAQALVVAAPPATAATPGAEVNGSKQSKNAGPADANDAWEDIASRQADECA
jgi:hypothetical protein